MRTMNRNEPSPSHIAPSASPIIRALALAAVLALTACEGTPFHDDLTAQTFEAASLQFGEASGRNRAAMAASRRDLRKPRRETPADATRRDTIISDYRNGAAQSRTTQPAGTGEQP